MKTYTNRLGLQISLAALASASLTTTALAQAQESANEIVVTGTAIRGVAPTGSATVNVNRMTLIESGVRDPSNVIAELPQGSGLGNTLQNNVGRNAGVNLRGLGTNATLLLFDGHRSVAQGVTNQIADPNTIPFAAIERVEVVTDGASAIYGSDAVAGVVNYILRKPYDGAEISARYQNSVYQQYGVDFSAGKTWNGGGAFFAVGYERNGHAKRAAVSPRLMQDLRAYGGNDNRLNGTTVIPGPNGALIVGNTVYAIPAGLNGRRPNASELTVMTAGAPGLYDTANYLDYFSQRERVSGVFRLNQDFGRFGETTLTVLANNRDNEAPGGGDGAFTNIGVVVEPASPYYIPGLGTGNQTAVYNFRLNNPGRDLDQTNTENTFNIYLDHKVDLFNDFQLTASGVYGNNFGCAVCQPQGNTFITGASTSTFNNIARTGAFNPYLQGPQPGAAGVFGGFDQKAHNVLADITFKIDGPLFDLPAGPVRVAAGYEYQKLDFEFRAQNTLNATTSWQTSRYAKSHRIINSGFAEFFLPLFGPDNAMPIIQRLDVSAAVRYDNYSDVGATTNPKVGISWEPHQDLLFRSSWGTSFRAPTLGESDPRTVGQTNRVLVANNLNNPLIPRTTATSTLILQRGGNSGNLGPESANIFSFGGDFTPSAIPGFKVSATYYKVDYSDRIQNTPNANTFLSNATLFDQVKDFFILAPQPTTCVNGGQPGLPGSANYATYNPAYLPWLNDPNAVYSPHTNNDCDLKGIFVGGTRNLGRVEQSGVDFSSSYSVATPVGQANFAVQFSKVLELNTQLTQLTPMFSALDTINNQNSERGRASFGLKRGPFDANVAANYVGAYLNNAPISVSGVTQPNTKIPSWTTFDAGLSWRAPEDSGMISGVRAAINVRNFTDKDPPVVLSGTNAVDLNNHSIVGRFWQFELTKTF